MLQLARRVAGFQSKALANAPGRNPKDAATDFGAGSSER